MNEILVNRYQHQDELDTGSNWISYHGNFQRTWKRRPQSQGHKTEGTVDFQRRGHQILSGGVGMPGPCSEGLVQWDDVGNLKEPALCGSLSCKCDQAVIMKMNSDTREVFQRAMLGRREGYEIKHFYLREIQKIYMTLSLSREMMKRIIKECLKPIIKIYQKTISANQWIW